MKRLKVGSLVLVILLVIGTLVLIGRREADSRSSNAGNSESMVLDADYDPGSAVDWKGPLPGEVARRFIVATTHEERMKYLRDPEENAGPMKAFYEEGPGSVEEVVGVKYLGIVEFETLTVEGFQAKLDNGKNRLLGVIITPEGGVIDFRSYARYGSESWPDLLDGSAKGADEVRVFLKPAFGFFGNFSNDRIWVNYTASSPDLEDPLYFYVKRDSGEDEELARIGSDGQRVTLSIRADGESYLRRQFEITKVLSPNWVMPEMSDEVDSSRSEQQSEPRPSR